MADTGTLSRRGFIIGTGATGLTIGILASCSPSVPDEPDYSNLLPNPEVNAWVHIDHDDTVTVRMDVMQTKAAPALGGGLVKVRASARGRIIGVEIDDSGELPGSDESHDVLWVDFHDISRFNNNRSTYRMVEKTRELRRAWEAHHPV